MLQALKKNWLVYRECTVNVTTHWFNDLYFSWWFSLGNHLIRFDCRPHFRIIVGCDIYSHICWSLLYHLWFMGIFWTRDFSLSFVYVSLKCWNFWLQFMELIRRKLHWRIIQIRGYRWFWATKSAWPLAAQFHLKKKIIVHTLNLVE